MPFNKLAFWKLLTFCWEFWGFHGGDISSRGHLGCDAV